MSKLVASNRKVRHLHGISLRNLALAKTTRPRGQTIDDEYLPTTLSSPAKLLAQKEGRLGHSQSFSDLKSSAIDEEAVHGATNGNTMNGSPQKAKNKRKQTLRRGSTLTWSNETPENRQRLMQDSVAERRVDSFFSLHRPGAAQDELPRYISEIKTKSMNADFQHFDLSKSNDISRSNRIVIKVWAGRSNAEHNQLVEADVELPSLVWLGKSLEDFEVPFSDNAIIFHLSDGLYTLMDYIPNIQEFLHASLVNPSAIRTTMLPVQTTASFDALMKLKDVTECIEDAVKTQTVICKQIEDIVLEHKSRTDVIEAATTRQAAARATQAAVEKEKHEVQKLRDERVRRQESLQTRRAAIDKQHEAQAVAVRDIEAETNRMRQVEVKQDQTRIARAGQLRRVAQDTLEVFPIEPIEGHFLSFTIRDLYLPNAKVFEDESLHKSPSLDPEVTAAALGFVAQVVVRLELYLGITLPYIPVFCGSTSTIFDPLSSAKELGLSNSSGAVLQRNKTSEQSHTFSPPTPESHPYRTFPLYQQGTQPKRFRWAIYLLNKDIEELMQQSGCKVMNPRTTLANLKYLLSVLASGRGELPGRKAGVVKALAT